MNEEPKTGTILNQTFAVYFGNFVPFLAICAIVLSPVLLLQTYTAFSVATGPDGMPLETSPINVGIIILTLALNLILPYVATGAMVYGVFQAIRGEPTSIGDCLKVGFARFLPILAVSLVIGVLTFLGMILCVVPGIIVYVVLAMAVPVVVIERAGIGDAMSRSAKLGEGYRWVVFGVLFGLGVLAVAVTFVLGFVTAFSTVANLLVTLASATIWTGLQATAVTLVYYNIRRTKESIDADEVAQVFA